MEDFAVKSGYRFRSVFLVVLLMTASFTAGGAVMYTVHKDAILGFVAQVAQLVPMALRVEKGNSITAATDLKPLATFWEVRDKVKRSFVYPIDDDTKLTYGAIRGMLSSLDDPYTRFMDPKQYADFENESEGHFDGIGAVLEERQGVKPQDAQTVIVSVIPGGPAAKAGLRPNDVIAKVDDKSVRGVTLNAVVDKIRGKRGTTVKLTVEREKVANPLDIIITRDVVDIPEVEYEMKPGNLGWVWLHNFNQPAEPKMREALKALLDKGAKGIVFDLEGNPGGLLDQAVAVSSLFVEDTPIVWVKERDSDPLPYEAHKGAVVPKDIPVVVMIDGGSASSSEIVTGCLQDLKRATIVGHYSYGKSKVQTVTRLNDGSALVLSTAVYLTPNKRDIGLTGKDGKRGIKPDIEFPEPQPNVDTDAVAWHNKEVQEALTVLAEKVKK
jgi:carboxyl-terminal processing protease